MTTRELVKLISDCKESKCIFDLVRLSNKISKIKLTKKNEKIWFEFLENI